MHRPGRAVRIAPLALLLACASPAPGRDLYQWTDAAGAVRYTALPDRIPGGRRHTLRRVEPGAGAWANAAPPAARIPPLPAPPPGAPAAPPSDPLEARIAELSARVAADEETLKVLISDPKLADTLRDSPELRAVGERLPELQAELARLLAERAARDGE